ncbi:hypothetical protein AAHC03_09384 [Spirometra sp. Aus1]
MERPYWKCSDGGLPKDALFVGTVLVNCSSLGLNLGLLVLLFLLNGKTRTFLVHLRALTASALFYSVIQICHLLIPYRPFPTHPILAPILCYTWMSSYLSIVSFTFAELMLNFIVGNRAIQIVCRYQHSFSNSRFADLAYVGGMGIVSFICMLPQAFIMKWDGKHCHCRDRSLPYGILVSLYTETYVRFGLTAVISTIILSISCYKIINWVRNTPSEQLTDTWNSLAFPGTTKERLETFSRPQGWMTASLCTVPLTVNFLVINIYCTGYKLICALGFCTVAPDCPFYRVNKLLTDLQLPFMPLIIIVYIPALRELPLRIHEKIISLCRWMRVAAPREQMNTAIP